jgi:hypothetical protein
MRRKKIVGSITLFLIMALALVAIGPPFLSSSEVTEIKTFEQRIGETDITIGFNKQIELFTNKEEFFKIKVNNSGDNNLMYYTSLELIGPKDIDVTSWGKSTFSIQPGDDYEFVFLLEGLKPGTYELELSVKEDFYASITLIEDVFRLGLLGFLPSLEGLMPDLIGMLPFIGEMLPYLVFSDMGPPFLDRFLTLVADSPTIATSITYSLMRELDDILLPLSELLSGIAKDLPSILGAWMSSLPETVGYLEEVLIAGPSYSLTHMPSFLTEGWPIIIKKLPKTVDGLLELIAYMRFWGPNTAAIALDNLREVWSMENVSLATHLTADALCLGLAALYLLGTPIGLLAAPIYETYHNNFLPVFEKLSSSVYNVASPIINRMSDILYGFTGPIGGAYKELAEGFFPPLFSFIIVPCIDAIISPLSYPLEEFLNERWAGISRFRTSPEKLARVSNEILAPQFDKLSDWLWRKGAEHKPVPFSAERGEASFIIKVEVRDMNVIESLGMSLKDIWDTTLGTIHGLATGEY